MNSFSVINVVDGDTIDVSPEWTWNGTSGARVRFADYNAPELDESGGQAAKNELERLILEEDVELKNPVNLDRGRLVCDVYFKGRNIVSYLQ